MHFRFVIALALCASSAASAQSRTPLTLVVHVSDSTKAPLESAPISVVRGLKEVLASGPTDRNGLRTLRVDVSLNEEFQVSTRRVGFQPVTKVFQRDGRDTLQIYLMLRRLPQALDTVRVIAATDLKRLHLSVNAEQIASFNRPLIDATDIVAKMRPDMIYGLGGKMFLCPATKNIWVNGQRIRSAESTFMMEAKKHTASAVQSKYGANAYRDLPLDVLSVLSTIKPEHISEIVMRECNDITVGKLGGDGAIFVTLKDGVRFETGVGSYVGSPASADSILKAITIPSRLAAMRAAASDSAPLLPSYRFRILGLFDAESGAPVAAADIVDIATYLHATTTETGTVALSFMSPGQGHIVIRKNGYRPDTLLVMISPADTQPITILLKHTDH
jgi:hypothetical protein